MKSISFVLPIILLIVGLSACDRIQQILQPPPEPDPPTPQNTIVGEWLILTVDGMSFADKLAESGGDDDEILVATEVEAIWTFGSDGKWTIEVTMTFEEVGDASFSITGEYTHTESGEIVLTPLESPEDPLFFDVSEGSVTGNYRFDEPDVMTLVLEESDGDDVYKLERQ